MVKRHKIDKSLLEKFLQGLSLEMLDDNYDSMTKLLDYTTLFSKENHLNNNGLFKLVTAPENNTKLRQFKVNQQHIKEKSSSVKWRLGGIAGLTALEGAVWYLGVGALLVSLATPLGLPLVAATTITFAIAMAGVGYVYWDHLILKSFSLHKELNGLKKEQHSLLDNFREKVTKVNKPGITGRIQHFFENHLVHTSIKQQIENISARINTHPLRSQSESEEVLSAYKQNEKHAKELSSLMWKKRAFMITSLIVQIVLLTSTAGLMLASLATPLGPLGVIGAGISFSLVSATFGYYAWKNGIEQAQIGKELAEVEAKQRQLVKEKKLTPELIKEKEQEVVISPQEIVSQPSPEIAAHPTQVTSSKAVSAVGHLATEPAIRELRDQQKAGLISKKTPSKPTAITPNSPRGTKKSSQLPLE